MSDTTSDQKTYRLISQYDDKTITVSGPVIIGRQLTCDFVLPYDSISRQHARLNVINDELTLEDMGTSNGTFVNGEKITKHVLNSGDIVAFDQYNYQVEIQTAKASPTIELDASPDKSEQQVEQPVNEGQETAAVKEKAKQENKTDSVESTTEVELKKEPVSTEPTQEPKIQQEPPGKPKLPPVAEITANKTVEASEKTSGKQEDSEEPKLSEQQSNINWWEKGEAGPKATKMIDAMDMAKLGVNKDTVSDVSVEEPVLIGISEAVAENVIKLKEGSLMVGRSAACDCVIDSEHISDKHAQIVYDAPTLKVIGMPNTTNGTFVNGDKVGGSVYLQSGDILSFGPIEFKVMLPGSNQKKEKTKTLNQQEVSEKSPKRLMPLIGAVLVVALVFTVWFLFK